jgi:hypothetical protein
VFVAAGWRSYYLCTEPGVVGGRHVLSGHYVTPHLFVAQCCTICYQPSSEARVPRGLLICCALSPAASSLWSDRVYYVGRAAVRCTSSPRCVPAFTGTTLRLPLSALYHYNFSISIRFIFSQLNITSNFCCCTLPTQQQDIMTKPDLTLVVHCVVEHMEAL